ncbi:Reverse transcriptase zinc-binding domain [Arabidopsis thaliana x Arabidopsis arenosa]|uniref:Reverse transcriptase zinc-binding domain n=1 Tax=Arabidopsis thaliana x Arabidopsis arenosa TaxID=1240361 RepID=A0A8T2A2A9_9BRAS|nr:Reverse transcriptase zinc-binding domain [Arabidopsis thaliana x Arabidopsis arenosa]
MKIIGPSLNLPPDPPDPSPPLSLNASPAVIATSSSSPPPASIPVNELSTAAPSYAERFKASLRNLRKVSSPVIMEEGNPVVQAPDSVLLRRRICGKDLETAPTWAVLHNVPPQMYSLDGISVIASAIGEPLHTEKSRLDPYNFGNTKVKVEISLHKSPPATIIVRDSQQNSVLVKVTYPRLPPKCSNCERFGHLLNRCPRPLMKKTGVAGLKNALAPSGSAIAISQLPLGKAAGKFQSQEWRVVGSSNQAKTSLPVKVASEPHKRTRIRSASRRRSKERSRKVKEVTPEVNEVTAEVPWTLVVPKKKGKEKTGQLVGPRKQIPGVMSVRKLAKLESKIFFSNKKLADKAQAKLSGPERYRIDTASTSSQPSRGSPSRYVRSWVNKHKPILGSLLETHVSEENADQILQATFPGWRGAMNYEFAENGDYNQILSASEHHSIIPHALPIAGMSEFMDCLVSNELFDMPSRGAFYTWSNGRDEDHVLRKLDRALINEHWSEAFPESLAVFEPPGDSDHSPCLVSTSSNIQRSNKSYKYFSFISTHPQFKEAMTEAWNVEVTVGSKLFTFGQRMRNVKASCKRLNRTGFSNIQQRTRESLDTLLAIQSDLMSSPTDFLFRAEFVARKKWNFFSKAQESFYRQKSRIRWMKDGDANTTFFHKSVIANQGRNCIKYLRGDDNEKIENLDQIKDLLVSYYKNLLGTENNGLTPMPIEEIRDLVTFRCMPALAAQLLQVPSEAEIRRTVASMPKNKAPGPDGFPVEFLWEAWDVVGNDTVAAIQNFFSTGHLPRGFNATAITLIPKVPGTDTLTQFRPISCCNSVYKVIARLLKQKLKLFISEAVQGNQVGFVQGRQLCENVLLASELVTNFNIPADTTRGCLQVDLAKAYDNLNWQFLSNVLNAINLPAQFIDWIQECFTTPSFSIAFNGELIDDILIFFDGKEESLCGILHILEEFRLSSGLGINKNKTSLFLDGGDFQEIQSLAARLGVSHGALPVRYLGVSLSSCKMKKQDFQPLIDRIHARFNGWTVKHLSFAGRLQLIQSVIYSTITFWASIFILPNKCLEEIESMCSAFLWKGTTSSARGAKVSWDSVCTPKKCGGLGLKRLVHWNKVLGLKLIWMIFAAGGSLWVSWIRRNLIGARCFWEMENINSGSWIWKSLCKLRALARPFIICEIGSRVTCNFWTDNWTSLGPLIELTGPLGPRVTGLPITAVVADALLGNQLRISLSRSRSPIIQLLMDCLPPSSLVNRLEDADDDVYLWKIGDRQASNVFSTSHTWDHLHPPGLGVDWYDSVWFSGRIPKHSFITWLNARHRLQTRDRMIRWNMAVPPACLLCNLEDESRQHLFFDCSYYADIWKYFCDKAHVSPPNLFDDGVRWMKNPCRDKNTALILQLAFQASIYYIWKERNSRLHISSSKPDAAIILEIKSILRCHLDPLTRAQKIIPPAPTLLVTWFGVFQ